jgi:2-iminobutanoate/2-iminopropanoate deaminase
MMRFLDSTEPGRSAGVVIDDLVFADASAPGAATVAEETQNCLQRLEHVLAQAGCTLADLVKVNSYLADDSYRAEFWETYNAVLAPGPYPPRLTQVAPLAGDTRVMLDAVAVRAE